MGHLSHPVGVSVCKTSRCEFAIACFVPDSLGRAVLINMSMLLSEGACDKKQMPVAFLLLSFSRDPQESVRSCFFPFAKDIVVVL